MLFILIGYNINNLIWLYRYLIELLEKERYYHTTILCLGWGTMREKVAMVLILGSLLCISGCFGQNTDTLRHQLDQQQEEIRQLKAQLSGVQPAQADTWAQVQSLRQELASITGQIDDFNHATGVVGGIAGLASKVEKNEAAIRKIEKQFDLKLLDDQPAPSSPISNTASPPVTPPQMNSSTGLNNESGAQTNSQPKQSTPNKIDTATVLYDTGVKLFNERKYKEALQSFTDFTNTYGTHKLISNAWFWRGEANYQLGSYPAAALDYEQVISKYPKSGKIVSCYFKQALCFYKTGKKDAAKFRLEEVIKKFPTSPEAKRAKQILKSDF